MLVKVIFLKFLTVVDFCDFEFKEASSLFREIEDFLNVDSRLACNKPKPPSRDLEMVREEIMSTCQKFDLHRNELSDDFPSNKDKFKFLRLLTDRKTDRLCLKGKPLSFK